MGFSPVLALVLAFGEVRSIPDMLPVDTAFLLIADDVPALRAATRDLTLVRGLGADDCAPLRAELGTWWREFVAARFDRVDATDLAQAPIRRAFLAIVQDDEGDGSLLIGVEGVNDRFVTIGTADDDENVVATWERWSFIADEEAVAHRPLDVLAGREPALASRTRYRDAAAALVDGGAHHVSGWIDRDRLVQAIGFWLFSSERSLDEMQKEFGAMAFHVDLVDGVIESSIFNEYGAEPSVLRIDTPRPFDDALFALVPRDARGFAALQWPLAGGLRGIATELAGDEATEDDADAVMAFADMLGERTFIVATAAKDGIETQWEGWFEVDPDAFETSTFDAAMDAIDRVLADDCTSGRFQRDDGRIIRELTTRKDASLPKTVWYSVAGSWLLATTTAERLDAMIAQAEGSALPGEDVRANPVFATAYARVREHVPAIHGVSFVDPRATFSPAADAWLTFARSLRSRDEPEFDERALRALHRLVCDEAPSTAISWHAPTGIITRHRGFPLGDFALAWCLAPGVMLHEGEVAKAIDLRQTNATRREGLRMELEFVKEAIERYSRDHGQLPESLQHLLVPDPRNFDQPYLDGEHRFVDSWGNPFRYETLANGEYRITCFGADGKRGGVGPNEDVRVVGP
ncbi:MAG: type II secretion system protein GspG [Planctomycetes bacterium]|nr:type II secretion system protein GspG [Planctomycetota bacterium]MCC7171590.1 type II secretion system protein GspG [Planctomycetota bacterium]